MAIPFGLGQLLSAAVLYWTLERPHEQVESQSDAGRYAYDGLDRVIHEKARLGILTSLIGRPDGLLFNDLKDLCTYRWQPQPAFDDPARGIAHRSLEGDEGKSPADAGANHG